MDARPQRVSMLLAVACSVVFSLATPTIPAALAASVRSQHFIVSAPTPEYARQVCEAAEQFRRDLAIEWLGQELPPWQDICPIQVQVGPHLGAGGATTFTFINSQPRDWHMEIQGSADRILDSVLPHEITHTVFATHFGRPLPRWADEGASTSVEHISERTKQDQLLIQFLTTNRGIAFNNMFAMKEYPPDILPLYSQGYSLARYLIGQGGRRKFVDYVYDGMTQNNWTAATQKHYNMQSLSELQVSWLDWVRQGSPIVEPSASPPTALASVTKSHPEPRIQAQDLAASTPRPLVPSHEASRLVPLPARGTPQPSAPTVVAPVSENALAATAKPDSNAEPADATSWYAKQRDERSTGNGIRTTELRPAVTPTAPRPTTLPVKGTVWR